MRSVRHRSLGTASGVVGVVLVLALVLVNGVLSSSSARIYSAGAGPLPLAAKR